MELSRDIDFGKAVRYSCHMVITIETDSLLSVAQTARRLDIARYTIYRWIEAGKIQAIRLGGTLFVPKEEVERLSK